MAVLLRVENRDILRDRIIYHETKWELCFCLEDFNRLKTTNSESLDTLLSV
jgi:hypothetical protein